MGHNALSFLFCPDMTKLGTPMLTIKWIPLILFTNRTFIKCFNEFLTIRTDWFLSRSGFKWLVRGTSGKQKGLSKTLPGRWPIFHSLSRQVHITRWCWIWHNSRENNFSWSFNGCLWIYKSALYSASSLDGWLFFWLHSIVCDFYAAWRPLLLL